MKTISMPYEEFEKELKEARAYGFKDGFERGVNKALVEVSWRVEHPFAETESFQDPSLEKSCKNIVEKIRKFFVTRSIQVRNPND